MQITEVEHQPNLSIGIPKKKQSRRSNNKITCSNLVARGMSFPSASNMTRALPPRYKARFDIRYVMYLNTRPRPHCLQILPYLHHVHELSQLAIHTVTAHQTQGDIHYSNKTVSISKYMFLVEGKYLPGVLGGITLENDSVSVCVSAKRKNIHKNQHYHINK